MCLLRSRILVCSISAPKFLCKFGMMTERMLVSTRALHHACSQGLLDVAQRLHSEGASVTAADDVNTPLHVACIDGHLDVAQWLHSAGASVNTTDIEGETPLHLACAKGHLDVAQWLHSVCASLNATSQVGNTLLHLACSNGHLAIAQWLHSVGTSVNAANIGGSTPLHHACYNGRLGIAQWLCSVGADATLKTNLGDTPAQLLQRPGRTAQLDQQALRSTLACLVRRAQAQGPLPCTAAPVQALRLRRRSRLLQVQKHRVLRRRPPPHPARVWATTRTCGCSKP